MESTQASPHTDLMTPPEKALKIAELERALAVLRSMQTATPCVKCDRFDDETGACAIWVQIVPLEHRANGCENWIELIPF